ncbi:MAG: tetratricopeptide repeat protein [Bacteroidota bacterium]
MKSLKLQFIAFFLLLPFTVLSQLNIDYYIQKGREQLYHYRYSEAIKTFNTVLEYRPYHPEAYFLRGTAKYNLQDYYGAESDYSQAIESKANAVESYYYRGMSRIQLYNFQGAIEDFNTTLKFVTGQPELFVQRGFCKLRLENYQEAIGDFNKALERDKKNKRSYYYRAISELNLDDTTAAIQDLSRAIQIDSAFTNPYVTRGRIFHQQEEYSRALEDFERALHFEPDNAQALIHRSLSHYQLNQYQKALDDLDRVIKIEPSNALAYYNRALLNTEIGAYDEAIEDYNQVLQYNPENILSYFNRGIVRMEREEYAKAIRDFSMAIKFFPNFAKAYINRSIARRELDDREGAMKDRQKAKQITQAYQDNRLERVNFADTTENFKRLISLQGSQNLPRHFGNIQESIEPRNIFSLYYSRGNDKNLTGKFRKYLGDSLITKEIAYLDKYFILGTDSRDTQSKDYYLKKIEQITDSIERYPDKGKYLFKRALLKEHTKNYKGALNDLATAGKHTDNQFLIHFLRANIRSKMIHYIKMMEDDTRIINIDMNNQLIEEPISREVTFHDYNKVIQDYNRSVQLAPKFVYTYYNRANIKIENKNHEEAINDFDKVIFMDSEFSQAYFNRGLTFIYLQQTTKGCIDISKAGELGIQEAYNIIKLYCQ